MPLYEFYCETCGLFECWRPMRESSDPMSCASCHEESRRVLSPPSLLSGAGSARHRREHEVAPRLVKRAPEETSAAVPAPRQQIGGRPWQLSH